MSQWIVIFFACLLIRIFAKVRERKSADALTRIIYLGSRPEAVALASTLIARPTPVGEFRREFFGSLGMFSLLYSFVTFSFMRTDSRTPHALALWDSDEKFYNLHDPDVYDAYIDWRATFFWDAGSVVLLALASLVLLSESALSTFFP